MFIKRCAIRWNYGLNVFAKHASTATFDHQSYQNLNRYVRLLKDKTYAHIAPVKVETRQSELYRTLQDMWFTVCITGNMSTALQQSDHPPILKDISLVDMNGEKLLKAAMHLNHDESETPARPVELDVAWMCPQVLSTIEHKCNWKDLCKDTSLVIKPAKCVIHTATSQGIHSGIVADHNKDPSYVGSLVVFLDSTFSDGDLDISLDNQKTTIRGANSWVAVRKECHYTFHPVTSGTRVSLIYDVYNKYPAHSDTQPQSYAKSVQYDAFSVLPDRYLYPTNLSDLLISVPLGDLSAPTVMLRAQTVPSHVANRVITALNKELDMGGCSAIVIALHGSYGESRTTNMLVGDDLVLYNMLCEQYAVEHVLATVCTHSHFGVHEATGALYSDYIVHRTLANDHTPVLTGRTKLVIPTPLKVQQLLSENTKAYGDNTVFIVSGLRVTKKTTPATTRNHRVYEKKMHDEQIPCLV